MKRNILILLVVLSSIIFCQDVPVLKRYATDYTNTLSSEEIEILNRDLKNFDDTTSNQIVFLMVSGKDVDDIFDFSIKVANQNQIGTKDKQNGVLFIVFKDIRKLRIEVGRGLEGALTDAVTNSIIRNEIAPLFKQGRYFEGIQAGIVSIKKACVNEYKIPKSKNKENLPWWIIPLALLIIYIIFSGFSGPRGGRRIISSYGGGYWIGGLGGFGGSSGGSDWGGFSGGGGSFGGGGSSGSW
ncbi:MAG TPA: TPM domain-containing protein [Ignavibacteriales bacterium]|nr:TPM domain-containing protein [Ignavibacteriales bacterium]